MKFDTKRKGRHLVPFSFGGDEGDRTLYLSKVSTSIANKSPTKKIKVIEYRNVEAFSYGFRLGVRLMIESGVPK